MQCNSAAVGPLSIKWKFLSVSSGPVLKFSWYWSKSLKQNFTFKSTKFKQICIYSIVNKYNFEISYIRNDYDLSTLWSIFIKFVLNHLEKGKHWGDTSVRNSVNFITANDTCKLMTEKETEIECRSVLCLLMQLTTSKLLLVTESK